jgi:hypothetical protein
MRLTDRWINPRVKRNHRQMDQRVQAAREHAIIRYVYGKRG